MPMIVLALVSSLAGAVSVVGGLMLVFGSLNSADFTQAAFIDGLKGSWGWSLMLLVLAIVGIVAQTRHAGQPAPHHQRGLVRRARLTSADEGSRHLRGIAAPAAWLHAG